MFTMAKIRDGATYLGNHLSANDYYAEGEKVAGLWVGQGAAFLGLRGEVAAEQFESLRSNRKPGSGDSLTPRNNVERIAFFDFQCSAQKSVSLMTMLAGDERLRTAHTEAAITAFAELEQFATRQQNTRSERHSVLTSNLCAAAFTHDASRALDPQLHTHFVVANATSDGSGKWYALNEFEMVKAIRYAGKVYQNELASRVRLLGYDTREVRNTKGEVTGFEIEGVSDALCQRYSKRRAEIEREIGVFTKKHGREPSTQEVAQITRETRGAKLAEISTPEVRAKQRCELTNSEWTELQKVKQAAVQRSGTVTKAEDAEMNALKTGADHLFERRSVFKEHEILAEALNQDLGRINLGALKAALAKETELVKLTNEPGLQSECATAEGLAMERWAVEFVNGTKGKFAPLCRDFKADGGLSNEQRAAVKAILSTLDQVFAFRGVAGSGKTTTLKELQRGLSGRRVYYVAPTAAAAKVLQGEGFSNATTVENFLRNVAKREILKDAVVICDEAGLKSNRQGARLLRLAEKHRMRVLLVGDVRQHVSVEAGDFLRVLEAHSHVGRCEVRDIRRQDVSPHYKEAVALMASGNARAGLERLNVLGWLHEGNAEYLHHAAADYVRLSTDSSDRCLVVAPTWDEHDRLTDLIRERLKTAGRLEPEGATMTVFKPLRWTIQQKRNSKNYLPGQILTFTNPVKGWQVGDSATVTRIEGGKVVLTDQAGSERHLNLKTADSFEVGSHRTLDVVPYDRILIRANRRRLGLVNGQVLTVKGVETDGSISTEEGVTIPRSFKEWCHGYVVTSHKSQGRTCEHVIVAAEMLDAKAAYVACSRGKSTCNVHTSDKDRLMSRLPEGSRKAALDVISKKPKGAPSAITKRVSAWASVVKNTVVRSAKAARKSLSQRLSATRLMAMRWFLHRGRSQQKAITHHHHP